MVNSNSAASAGGVYNDIGEVTFDDTSTVSGNSEPQCVGVVCPIVE
ncbi:MAG: hypothetical protein M9928_12325 [Anaerolineae bacterium]|nr:hypothetical protein [Anaerolineae bacterium]